MLHYDTLAGPEAPLNGESGTTVSELLSILVVQARRNILLLVLCGILGVLVAAAASALIEPAYVATAELLVNPTDLNIVDNDLTRRSDAADSGASVLETQVKILSSDKVLSRVVDTLHLQNDPAFTRRPFWRDGGLLEAVFVTLGAATQGKESLSQSALDRLRTAVTVRRTERTFVIDINARTPAPSSRPTSPTPSPTPTWPNGRRCGARPPRGPRRTCRRTSIRSARP